MSNKGPISLVKSPIRRKAISWNYLREQVVALAVNLLASAIVYHFSSSYLIALCAVVVGSILIGIGYWLLRLRLRTVGIIDIFPYQNGVRPAHLISINERLDGLEREFCFMGVSGKSLHDTRLWSIMRSNANLKCTFRLLLMDPDGKALARHMKRENEGTVGAHYDIKAFLGNVQSALDRAPQLQVEVRYYDFDPAFWLLGCDERVYVQSFPDNATGQDSPLLVLDTAKDGFGKAFLFYFEEIWEHHATKVSLNRHEVKTG